MGEPFLRLCRHGVINYVVMRPLTTTLAFITEVRVQVYQVLYLTLRHVLYLTLYQVLLSSLCEVHYLTLYQVFYLTLPGPYAKYFT